MEIRDAGYRVWYEPQTATIYFEGAFRLSTKEYDPISDLLQKVVDQGPARLTLHVKELEFLNSSGINALYKFVIAVRKKGDIHLSVRGTEAMSWQTKSLPNLRKFLPALDLQLK